MELTDLLDDLRVGMPSRRVIASLADLRGGNTS
jgi:hypothetical protein